MILDDCPPWIDPGNAFRLIVRSASYKANLDYGFVDIADQEHELWLDLKSGYSLRLLEEDLAAKMIWGRVQDIVVWGLDPETNSEWRVTSDTGLQEMIDARLDVRVMYLAVEVVEKDGYKKDETFAPASCIAPCTAQGSNSSSRTSSSSGGSWHSIKKAVAAGTCYSGQEDDTNQEGIGYQKEDHSEEEEMMNSMGPTVIL